VVKNQDGTLHGELVEFAAMGPILNKYGFWDELTTEIAIANFGQEAFRAGCTSAADMGLTDFSNPELMTNYIRMTREEDFRFVCWWPTVLLSSKNPSRKR
jgi:hypothetical protein